MSKVKQISDFFFCFQFLFFKDQSIPSRITFFFFTFFSWPLSKIFLQKHECCYTRSIRYCQCCILQCNIIWVKHDRSMFHYTIFFFLTAKFINSVAGTMNMIQISSFILRPFSERLMVRINSKLVGTVWRVMQYVFEVNTFIKSMPNSVANFLET